jgi:hypothetical protein
MMAQMDKEEHKHVCRLVRKKPLAASMCTTGFASPQGKHAI